MKRITMFTKRFIILIILCLETTFVSCKDKITKIELINKNPTEYIFNASKDSLFMSLTKDIIFMRLAVMTIKNKRIIPSKISELLFQVNNNQDIFLESIDSYCKSKIYKFEKGEFLDYWVSFYLHLEKIDENRTKVKISTIDPKVVAGRELLPKPLHFVRKNITISVEPSTIEEYEILLEIGKLVGEKDMPSLKLPE